MIDSHCHIDEDAYAADREQMLQRQKDGGIEAIVIPGVDVHSMDGIFDVCRRWRGFCYPVLGLHPQNVAEDWQEQLGTLHEAMIAHTREGLDVSERIVAIGEIGLDYHYTRDFDEAQHEVFRTQLRWAQQLDLPVIIHSRDATADCLNIVKEETMSQTANSKWPNGKCLGVIHCYSGSAEVAQQWLDMGLYLGIGGVLTFKNSRLAENLAHVPLERLLLETDGPYLAPAPHRGERNEPILMRFVAMKLAEVYQCTPAEVIEVTSANSRKLFRLPAI
ncbi:MAG: TatD family hydrolase [Paludibacteraceae bacterium]|nr:TatD family hydrolase [Paludibacteraceae bacterium]